MYASSFDLPLVPVQSLLSSRVPAHNPSVRLMLQVERVDYPYCRRKLFVASNSFGKNARRVEKIKRYCQEVHFIQMNNILIDNFVCFVFLENTAHQSSP